MTRRIPIATFSLLIVLLAGPVFGQDESEPKEIKAEGAIVAFKKGLRYPGKPQANGIFSFNEFWIVRIDKLTDDHATLKDKKFVLVLYVLRQRGLTDPEINASKLLFTLRERGEWHTDCRGAVFVGDKTRPSELADYERTKPGKVESIPELRSLPCLIANGPPIVIE